MRFPKKRIKITNLYEGHASQDGYLVLDIKGLDIEGATSLVIDMADVDVAREKGAAQEDASRRLRDLLS